MFGFFWGAGKLLQKTKNVLLAAVQYVPNVRDIITVERDRPQFMFTKTSYHSQTVTSFSRSGPAVWSLFQFLAVGVIAVFFHVKNERVVGSADTGFVSSVHYLRPDPSL